MDSIWLRKLELTHLGANSIANLIPLLKTNSYGTNGAPYQALLALLMKAGVRAEPLAEDTDLNAMSVFLLDRNLAIAQLYTHLMQLDQMLATESGDQIIRALVLSNIELIRSCGFGNFETLALLTEQDPDKRYTPEELLELDLSQTELVWCVSRLISLLERQCAKGGALASAAPVKTTLHEMKSIANEIDARSYLEVSASQGS